MVRRFVVALLLVGAVALYSILWLPSDFGGLSIAQWYLAVTIMMSVTWTVVVWRRESLERALPAGLALVGGLVSLFWPALEVVFQHIDGGAMSLYGNVVFVASTLFSVCAIAASVVAASRPEWTLRLLVAATVGTAVLGLIAPNSPPSARRELMLGLPILSAATTAIWWGSRRNG